MKTLPPPTDIDNKSPCPEPGVYYEIPADEYHAWPAMNHSTINGFFESTAMGVHELGEEKDTKEMAFGNAFHTRFLEPALYKKMYVVSEGPINPSTKKPYGRDTVKYRNWEVDFLAGLEDGQKVISSEDAKTIERMIESVKENPNAMGFVDGAYKKREMCIVWDEVFNINGEDIVVRCKARIDLYIDRLGEPINMPAMMDLKSANSANIEKFMRVVWDRGYHRQMAWYLRGLHMLGMMPKVHEHAAMILACEKTPPYQSAIYYINHDSILQGMKEAKNNAIRYIEWRLTGKAQGLPTKPRPIGIPAWQQDSRSEVNTVNMEGERL